MESKSSESTQTEPPSSSGAGNPSSLDGQPQPPSSAGNPLELEENEQPQTQRFNILGNTLQSMDLATHEYACTWLEHLKQVPDFLFPWSKVTWEIAANKDTVSWLHADIISTSVNPAVGEKLWYLATHHADLPADDLCGIMRSRSTLNGFNGWEAMMSVWKFEQVHISPYTTLYMPATFVHAAISITDCITTGCHAIPISNISHYLQNSAGCLLNCLRCWTWELDSTHLSRPYCAGVTTAGSNIRLTNKTKVHLPNLSTSSGIIDLLALRGFIVLVVALNSACYAHAVDRNVNSVPLLPLETEKARELSLAWKLAHDLMDHISTDFSFQQSRVPVESSSQLRTPASFQEAVDRKLSLVTMVVFMHRYVSLIASKEKSKGKGKSKLTLPEGFNAKTFEEQTKRMLVLFELHKVLSTLERKTQSFANPGITYKGQLGWPLAMMSATLWHLPYHRDESPVPSAMLRASVPDQKIQEYLSASLDFVARQCSSDFDFDAASGGIKEIKMTHEDYLELKKLFYAEASFQIARWSPIHDFIHTTLMSVFINQIEALDENHQVLSYSTSTAPAYKLPNELGDIEGDSSFSVLAANEDPTLVVESAYCESYPHILTKAHKWFRNFDIPEPETCHYREALLVQSAD
ncbi:hypothetical protein C8R45DRAFT_948567 [Mycena sanguinolenta]|nr:hypothetical protein C8R45DRAFT_948567 [Mycena sanguinolenta]